MIVTVPSGAIRMKELGSGITGAGWFCAKRDGLKYKPSSIPPPPTAVTCKNARRLIDLFFTGASCPQDDSHCSALKKNSMMPQPLHLRPLRGIANRSLRLLLMVLKHCKKPLRRLFRMTLRIFGFFLLSFVLGVAVFATTTPVNSLNIQDERAADREAIRAHIDSIFQAFIKKDVAALRATHAENWLGYLEGSRTTIKGVDGYMECNQVDPKRPYAITNHNLRQFT